MQDATVTVLGALAIIVANIIIVLQNRRQNIKVNDEVVRVKKTLTEPNGGAHVKDQLNRIEESVKVLHVRDATQMRLLSKLNNSLHEHVKWAEGMKEDFHKRLKDLEDDCDGIN